MASTAAPAKQKRRTLLTLHYDVLVDIVGLVAATSQHPFDDLNSIGATCKAMYAATKEPKVLRRVALEKEKMVEWCDNSRFLHLLANLVGAGNPEACFLSGLMHVFTDRGKQPGLALLKEAVAAGHKTAAYVLGIVLYGADDTRDAAKRYINQVEADTDVGIGCEPKIANRNCRRCRLVAMLAILEMRRKKKAGAPSQVLRASYDSGCTSKWCALPTEWPVYNSFFCSDDCRIRFEYSKFLTLIAYCDG